MREREIISNAQAMLMEARVKGDKTMTLEDAIKKTRAWAVNQEKAKVKASAKNPAAKTGAKAKKKK